MARARSLKPGFFKNEDLALLQPHARLVFAGLWTLADREGRLEDRPLRIKAEILPYENVDVNALLDELKNAGFITRYEVNGLRCIAIPTWKKHQFPHVKEPASTIPAPGQNSSSTGGPTGSNSASLPSVPVTCIPVTSVPVTSSRESVSLRDTEAAAAAARVREKDEPAEQPPAQQQQQQQPEHDKAAWDLAVELSGRHWTKGNPQLARAAIERRLAESTNPATEAAIMRRRHAEWLPYYIRRARDRTVFRPTLDRWISQGDYLITPPQELEAREVIDPRIEAAAAKHQEKLRAKSA